MIPLDWLFKALIAQKRLKFMYMTAEAAEARYFLYGGLSVSHSCLMQVYIIKW